MTARNTRRELAAVALALLLPIPLFVASGMRLPLPGAIERGLASLDSGLAPDPVPVTETPARARSAVRPTPALSPGTPVAADDRRKAGSAAAVVAPRTAPAGGVNESEPPAGGDRPLPAPDAPPPTGGDEPASPPSPEAPAPPPVVTPTAPVETPVPPLVDTGVLADVPLPEVPAPPPLPVPAPPLPTRR